MSLKLWEESLISQGYKYFTNKSGNTWPVTSEKQQAQTQTSSKPPYASVETQAYAKANMGIPTRL